jgi:hypothetical protein
MPLWVWALIIVVIGTLVSAVTKNPSHNIAENDDDKTY